MHHIWFIAIEEERVVGFMPVEIKDKYAVINNYYIDKDDPDLLAALLREVIRHYAGQYKLQSVTHSRHLSVFAANGFSISGHGNYMQKWNTDNKKPSECI